MPSQPLVPVPSPARNSTVRRSRTEPVTRSLTSSGDSYLACIRSAHASISSASASQPRDPRDLTGGAVAALCRVSKATRTSSMLKRRCPPGVVSNGMRPLRAYICTVAGRSPRAVATSDVLAGRTEIMKSTLSRFSWFDSHKARFDSHAPTPHSAHTLPCPPSRAIKLLFRIVSRHGGSADRRALVTVTGGR